MLTLPASLPAKPSFLCTDTPSIHPSLPPRPKRTTKSTESRNEPEEVWHTPWIDGLPMTEYEGPEQRLHDEIVAFVQYAKPTPEENTARDKLVMRLTELIQRRFWNCEVKIFGSVAQELSLPGGDVDVTIRTSQVHADNYRTKCLFELSRMLRDSSFSDKPFVVANAKVPILTFETRPPLGELKFDVNINADDGLSMIPHIKRYLDTIPALRPMVLLVKAFLTRKGLNSAATGGLGSYATTLLIISFLQLRPGDRPTEVYDRPMENESLGLLLMDFFEYYHNKFPYETSYISVLHAGLLPKDSKGWLREKYPEALSIESIVDPDKDVGRACGKIGQVRSAFGEAYNTLKAYPLSATNGNILGSILGLSSRAIGHRERTISLVRSGDLEKALTDVMLPPPWGSTSGLHHGSRDNRSTHLPRDAYHRDRYPPSYGRRQDDYPRGAHYRPYPDTAPYRGTPSHPYGNQQHSYQPYQRPHCPW